MSLDKKDLLIQSLINQRNRALDALADCESQFQMCINENATLQEEIKSLKSTQGSQVNESV